jgi:hypothetical protein
MPASTRSPGAGEVEARRIAELGEAALDLRTVLHEARRQRWVDRPPIGLLALGVLPLELLHHGVHLLGVEHRHRRTAIRAGGSRVEVDRGAAARAGDGPDALLELLDLGRAQRAHEVLLPQELEERDEAAVLAGAAPVAKSRGPLHVRREEQALAAVRAEQAIAHGFALGRLVVVDHDEQRSTAPGVRARLSTPSNQSEAQGLQMSSVTSLA